MKQFSVISLVSFLLVLSAPSFGAVEKTVEPQFYVLCKNQSVVRTIRVESSDKGCQAKYTKAGVDRIVGYGKSVGSCNQFAKNVQKNLEAASWECRELKSSSITASQEVEEPAQESTTDVQ